MSDKPVPPSVAEFTLQERQQLLATIARYETTAENYELLQAKVDEQAREIERLEAEVEDVLVDWGRVRLELAALKAQTSGVVLPERDAVISKAVGMCNRIPGSTTWNAAEYAYDEIVARLNSSPVSAAPSATPAPCECVAVIPAGWRAEPITLEGICGFIIGTPRENGVRSNTSIWPDDEDPAHQLLVLMLAQQGKAVGDE